MILDFDLLWEFVIYVGIIMDREVLLKNLWGVSYDGMDCSIDVVILCLCCKFYDNVLEFFRIKIVCNKGYLFVFNVWELV